LFWWSSYVASHGLAVAPQSGTKQIFCCTVYYITLNSNCDAQRVSKNFKKIMEDRVRSQMNVLFECIFLLFKGEK
jgi:hypothetical protein